MARDRYEADWIIYCDVDEFVCTHGKSLRTVLAECDRDGITLLDLPRRTMTGPLIPPGGRATEVLTLRIDRAAVPTTEQLISWDLPVPFAFLEVGGHVAVRAAAIRRSPAGCIATVNVGHERHERSVHPALRHPWIRGIAAEGAQHREVARGQPASSAPVGLALAKMDSAGESRTPAGGLRRPVRLGRACERAGCGWHLRGRHDDCRVARKQEDAPGCGRPSMVRLAATNGSSLCRPDEARRHNARRGAGHAAETASRVRGSAIPVGNRPRRIYSNFGPLAIRLEHRLAAHFRVGDHAVTTVANATLGLALALTAHR